MEVNLISCAMWFCQRDLLHKFFSSHNKQSAESCAGTPDNECGAVGSTVQTNPHILIMRLLLYSHLTNVTWFKLAKELQHLLCEWVQIGFSNLQRRQKGVMNEYEICWYWNRSIKMHEEEFISILDNYYVI